ncbi:hypothetical protein [Flavobacterium sp.]|uniref:hypothetical protein n=1 Tax=Flavobacterium sp. TaxID=239 RepID=UPI003A90BAD2
MKRNTLLGLLFLFVSLVSVSCSDDQSNVEMNNGDTALSLKTKSSIWDRPLVEIQNGQPVLIVPESDILLAFNEYFKARGYTEQVQTVSVVKKVADNDSSISRFFLVGATGNTVSGSTISANMMLSSDRFGSYQLGADPTLEFVPFCIGCPNGCHIKFLKYQDELIPYCDEGPCTIYWCDQNDEGNAFNY